MTKLSCTVVIFYWPASPRSAALLNDITFIIIIYIFDNSEWMKKYFVFRDKIALYDGFSFSLTRVFFPLSTVGANSPRLYTNGLICFSFFDRNAFSFNVRTRLLLFISRLDRLRRRRHNVYRISTLFLQKQKRRLRYVYYVLRELTSVSTEVRKDIFLSSVPLTVMVFFLMFVKRENP